MLRDRKRCEAFVRSYGGKVVYAPHVPGYSTSEIIRRIRAGEQLPDLPDWMKPRAAK